VALRYRTLTPSATINGWAAEAVTVEELVGGAAL